MFYYGKLLFMGLYACVIAVLNTKSLRDTVKHPYICLTIHYLQGVSNFDYILEYFICGAIASDADFQSFMRPAVDLYST